MGCREEHFGVIEDLIRDAVGKELKIGKGRHQGCLGRNNG